MMDQQLTLIAAIALQLVYTKLNITEAQATVFFKDSLKILRAEVWIINCLCLSHYYHIPSLCQQDPLPTS